MCWCSLLEGVGTAASGSEGRARVGRERGWGESEGESESESEGEGEGEGKGEGKDGDVGRRAAGGERRAAGGRALGVGGVADVSRVVERPHGVTVDGVHVCPQLEQRAHRPVVPTRGGGVEWRDIPAQRVDVRGGLDQQPHHLAVALRLVDAGELQRRHEIAVLLAQQRQPQPRLPQQLLHDQLPAGERRDRQHVVPVVVDG